MSGRRWFVKAYASVHPGDVVVRQIRVDRGARCAVADTGPLHNPFRFLPRYDSLVETRAYPSITSARGSWKTNVYSPSWDSFTSASCRLIPAPSNLLTEIIILDSPQRCGTTSMPPLSAAIASFLASSGEVSRVTMPNCGTNDASSMSCKRIVLWAPAPWPPGRTSTCEPG